MKSYRLPDGKITTSSEEYCSTWKELYNQVLEFFPGYIVNGFDPTISLYKYKKNRFGESIVVDRLQMSVIAAQTLINKDKNVAT